MNAALPTWIVCGSPTTVFGTLAYNPPAGTVLPVGSHTLCVTFTPTDTANYNNAIACVTLNVLTGHPIVVSCTFAPTTIQWEERIQVIVRDTTGPVPEVARRLAQELVVRDQVDFLAGFGLTPEALAVAEIATQAKKPKDSSSKPARRSWMPNPSPSLNPKLR